MPQMTPAMARLERSAAQAREELKRFYGEVGLAAVARALGQSPDLDARQPESDQERHISAAVADHIIAA